MGTWSRVIHYPVTILSGQQNSDIVIGWHVFGSSAGLSIHSPAVLAEAVNIQVSPECDAPTIASQWNNWYDGSPLVQQQTPLAGTSAPFVVLVTNGAFRLRATAAVAADRVFYITYQATF